MSRAGWLLCIAPLALWATAPLQAQEDAQPMPAAPAGPGAPPPPPPQGQSASGHVAPEAPSQPLAPMGSGADMAHSMSMNDASTTGTLLVEELEWVHTDGDDSLAWLAEGYYGNDYNKLWIKTEGDYGGDAPPDARLEVLWDRVFNRWWNLQAGVRLDVDSLARVMGGSLPTRAWAALGLQGLAPGWFDVEATAYVSDGGHAAARLKSSYDLLLTQRLILQPEIEANLESRADPARLVGGGLTDIEAGLRLRYEIRRQIAPYIGIAGKWHVGATANRVRAAGYATDERGLVVGIRAWF